MNNNMIFQKVRVLTFLLDFHIFYQYEIYLPIMQSNTIFFIIHGIYINQILKNVLITSTTKYIRID